MPTTTNRVFSFHRFAVLALILFSFFMGMLVANRVFERLPHLEDEMAYLFQARTLAGGNLVIETPALRRAFWQPFVVDFPATGLRFGKYSLGWPALLTFGVAAGDPWIVNAFFGALTIAVAYRLGSSVFNRDVGLVAAALTAFSPMALLLNGTVMGHSAALFGSTLFMLAYWYIDRRKWPLRWAVVAGLALGIVLVGRPLTALAVSLPFVVWSLARLLRALLRDRPVFWPTLRPLIVIGVLTVTIGTAIPLYNAAATGKPGQDLYTLVWSYDTVGFGGCCGRSVTRGEVGHIISKGLLQARFDLSLTAADLFGWQIGEITPDVAKHLREQSDYYPRIGLSFILLPLGLLVAFKRKFVAVAIWFVVGFLWLWIPLVAYNNGQLSRSPTFSYIWLGAAFLWLLLPLVPIGLRRLPKTRVAWSWLFVAVVLGMVGLHMAYWIGSQRYSTRYYFEALTSAALLSALPIAWLARRVGRWPIYALFTVVLVYSLYAYSTPRIGALYHYNNVMRSTLDELQARRDGRPVLVIVEGGSVAWRAYGALMAQTSPYLDSDIVAGWDYLTGNIHDQLVRKFPDRQVIEILGEGNNIRFKDEGAAP